MEGSLAKKGDNQTVAETFFRDRTFGRGMVKKQTLKLKPDSQEKNRNRRTNRFLDGTVPTEPGKGPDSEGERDDKNKDY